MRGIYNRVSLLERYIKGSGPAPTFEEFAAEWSRADPLSKSLYEAAMSAPELVGVPRHWPTIKGYLRRLGVQPQEFTLESVVNDL